MSSNLSFDLSKAKECEEQSQCNEEIHKGEEEKLFKIAKIESGLYDNGELKLLSYLEENYFNCTVCFICESENYLKYSKLFKCKCKECVFLFSDDKETQRHLNNVKKVVENASLIVCLDNPSVNFAKNISLNCIEECLFYFPQMPTLDAFLPFYINKNKEFKISQLAIVKNYIVCYTEPNQFNREDLIESVFSCLSYICIFLECIINAILFKERLSAEFKQNFANIIQRFNSFLEQTYFMPDDFLDNYLLFLEDFATFLFSYDQNLHSKENVFLSIYQHFNSKVELTANEIRIIGAYTFCQIYLQFFKNLDHLEYGTINLQKRIELLDVNFQELPYFVGNYSQEKAEKITYLIKRNKDKLAKKTQCFMQLFEGLLNKSLDLYLDSGLAFNKKFNQNSVLKSIYFTPDFLQNNSLLKIIRDFGVLDYL